MYSYQLLSLFNAGVCTAIIFTCICRLSLCHLGISKLVRLKYTTLLTGAMAHGFQPILFGEMPSVGGIVFACAVMVGLLCSAHRWRRHPPAETVTRPAELY